MFVSLQSLHACVSKVSYVHLCGMIFGQKVVFAFVPSCSFAKHTYSFNWFFGVDESCSEGVPSFVPKPKALFSL